MTEPINLAAARRDAHPKAPPLARPFMLYWERAPRGVGMLFRGDGTAVWALQTGRRHYYEIQPEGPFKVWERWPSRLTQTLVDFVWWPRLIENGPFDS